MPSCSTSWARRANDGCAAKARSAAASTPAFESRVRAKPLLARNVMSAAVTLALQASAAPWYTPNANPAASSKRMVAGKQTTTAAAWTAANAQRPNVPWLLAQPQTEITASAGALTDDNKLTEATCVEEATCVVEATAIRALCICGSSIRRAQPRDGDRSARATGKKQPTRQTFGPRDLNFLSTSHTGAARQRTRARQAAAVTEAVTGATGFTRSLGT